MSKGSGDWCERQGAGSESSMSSAFVGGQLLSQVTSSLVNMKEVGIQLLSGTFEYFGGTERQVAVGGSSHSFGLSHNDFRLKAMNPNE